MFCKGEECPSRVETDIGGPVGQIRRIVSRQIMMDGIEVETPSISSISLYKCVLEESPPFGAEDVLLEISTDGIEASFDVESLEEVEISSQFGDTLMIILIHGCGVDGEVAGNLIKVIA